MPPAVKIASTIAFPDSAHHMYVRMSTRRSGMACLCRMSHTHLYLRCTIVAGVDVGSVGMAARECCHGWEVFVGHGRSAVGFVSALTQLLLAPPTSDASSSSGSTGGGGGFHADLSVMTQLGTTSALIPKQCWPQSCRPKTATKLTAMWGTGRGRSVWT